MEDVGNYGPEDTTEVETPSEDAQVNGEESGSESA